MVYVNIFLVMLVLYINLMVEAIKESLVAHYNILVSVYYIDCMMLMLYMNLFGLMFSVDLPILI